MFANNREIRHTLFYPLSKDQLFELANVCLNDDSPFNDASKAEIKAAFVDKNILSRGGKNARSGNVKNTDSIPDLSLEEKDTINDDAKQPQVVEIPNVEYTVDRKTVTITRTTDVIKSAIHTLKIDLTKIENIIINSPVR